jgi:hypothetical protein
MAQGEGERICFAMHLLGPAFPSLRQLDINFNGSDLGSGYLSFGLEQCKQLSKLSLLGTRPTAVKASAAALARLPALRDFTFSVHRDCDINPAALIDQLTRLTALKHELSRTQHVVSVFAAAARNPGLQTFTLSRVASQLRPYQLDAAEAVRNFLTSCASLTHLDLSNALPSERTVDAILTHGTSITHLTVGALATSTNHSDQPSNLQSLSLQESDWGTLTLQLANLPLRGVTHLCTGGLGWLELPTACVPAHQLPAVLGATTNLAACAAWQAKPEHCIYLRGDDRMSNSHIHLTPEAQLQLLEALAPVGGPHVREFNISVEEASFSWGRAQVEALGRSLRSTQLSSLDLSYCTVHRDFWAAVDEVWPSLKFLRLGDEVTCSASALFVFCSRRQAGKEFTLGLAPELYDSHNGAGLQDSLRAQGLPLVSVVSHASGM